MTRRDRDRSIRHERDIQTAGFLDGYADAVEIGLSWGPNKLRHPPEIRALLTVALRGLASSIRAGLVDAETEEEPRSRRAA